MYLTLLQGNRIYFFYRIMPTKGGPQESTASSCVDDEGGVARAQEIVPVCHTGGLPLGSPAGDGAGLEKHASSLWDDDGISPLEETSEKKQRHEFHYMLPGAQNRTATHR